MLAVELAVDMNFLYTITEALFLSDRCHGVNQVAGGVANSYGEYVSGNHDLSN